MSKACAVLNGVKDERATLEVDTVVLEIASSVPRGDNALDDSELAVFESLRAESRWWGA